VTTPADELRIAAAKLRATASGVGSAPGISNDWAADGTTVTQGTYPDTGEPVYPVADAASPQCAAYIAAMHPGVGLVLADWLDYEAGLIELMGRAAATRGRTEHALAAARAINGGTR
jgi:hypothetical protein